MNYKAIGELSSDIFNNIHMIPHDVDLIVGVPRSGLLVANMIGLLLNKPITDVDGLLKGRIIKSGATKKGGVIAIEDCRKILIVEDTVASGESIQSVKQRIAESGQDCEFLYFAAYIEPGKEQLVDMFLEIIPQPRMFEWNIFHHSIIENSCIDIDGVLCIDPSKEENDDGKKYLNFIRTARPKFIPSHRINSIVSSRLEEYRTETEEWLANNGIEYENLYLLNTTAENRRTKSLHALFKAKVYGASDCSLFIESNLTQAEQIRRITGKPVYCVENNHLYDGSDIYKITNETTYSKIGPLYRLLSRNRVLKKIYRAIRYRL